MLAASSRPWSIGVAFLVVMASTISAQPFKPSQSNQPGPKAQTDSQFTSEEIAMFAKVYHQIKEIRAKNAKRIQGKTPQEIEQIKGEVLKGIMEAIRSVDLDMKTYSAIHRAARRDPALRKRIMDLVEAESE